MPRDIVYCAPGSPDEGAPHGFMAAYWLRSRGFNVEVFCQGDRPAGRIATPMGEVPVQYCGASSFAFQKGLAAHLMKRRGSDCLYYFHGHVTTPAAFVSTLGLPSRRIVYHTQDYLEPGRHPHWEYFERGVAKRAGCVISNEVNRARFLASHYRLREFPVVVRTTLPAAWPRPRRSEQVRCDILKRVNRSNTPSSRLIMHEGAFAEVRCGMQLLKAFARLPDDYVLVFTGMPPAGKATEEATRLIKELKLAGRVVMLDRLPFSELMSYTAACDVGMLLYPNDGVGNFYQAPGRLTHYMGAGLPIVASNFPGLELLVLKSELGSVCDSSSPDSIAAAVLKEALKSFTTLDEQRRRLKELARSELSYDNQVTPLEQVIRRLV